MHVYKKPSGKWAYKIDIGKNPLTGKRQQKEKGGFARAKDAKIAGEKMLQQLRSKVFSRPESITFGDFAAEWLEAYKTLVKISTVRIREHQLLNLKRFFDKIPLQQIGKKQYQDALLALTKDFSPNTISGIHATARMIFRRAKEYDLILTDPTEYATVPRPKRKIVDPDSTVPPYLEKDQLLAFLSVAEKNGYPPDYELFSLLSYTGLRIGEALALTWEDVDFKKNILKVSKTLYNPTNRAESYSLLPPKTETSVRIISLPTSLRSLLARHKLETSSLRLEYGSEWHIPERSQLGFIFTAPTHPGFPLTQRLVQIRIDRLQRLMLGKIPFRIHPHIFRHTHASLLAEAGVDLVQIMKRLGHADDSITRQIYLHVTKTAATETAERFDKLLNSK